MRSARGSGAPHLLRAGCRGTCGRRPRHWPQPRSSPRSICSRGRPKHGPTTTDPGDLGRVLVFLTAFHTATPKQCSIAGGAIPTICSPSNRSKSRKDGNAHEAKQVRRHERRNGDRKRQAAGGNANAPKPEQLQQVFAKELLEFGPAMFLADLRGEIQWSNAAFRRIADASWA